jgi:hypothetical protein
MRYVRNIKANANEVLKMDCELQVKLLCLHNHHAIKKYGRVEVQLYVNSALDGVELQTLAASPSLPHCLGWLSRWYGC